MKGRGRSHEPTQMEPNWTHHSNFSVYGARIGVRTNSAAVLPHLQAVFPPHWKPLGGRRVDWEYSLYVAPRSRARDKAYHLLYSNGEIAARAHDVQALVTYFDQDVQLAVAQKARGKVFVHAGVVGWHGRAILIPGRSFTGKSTLTHALVRAGAVYYSDEYAVLDTRGRVYPFARRLALRDEKQVNRKVPFAELGGQVGKTPIPVGTILVTKYRAGATWRPRALTPGLGALELLANTVAARSGQPIILEALTRAARDAKILKGARGDAALLASHLLERLE